MYKQLLLNNLLSHMCIFKMSFQKDLRKMNSRHVTITTGGWLLVVVTVATSYPTRALLCKILGALVHTCIH